MCLQRRFALSALLYMSVSGRISACVPQRRFALPAPFCPKVQHSVGSITPMECACVARGVLHCQPFIFRSPPIVQKWGADF